MFELLTNDKPFLKVGLFGFAGSGKTKTAYLIAIGLHKLIKSTLPIAIHDPERAAKAQSKYFRECGVDVVKDNSRTLASLKQNIIDCEQKGIADILIVDGLVTIYDNYLTAYKEEKKKYDLSMKDWGILKPKWKKDFSDVFLNANLHIIFTGRAGFEYENELNEHGKREIYKSGVKMKGDNETAFEPDIVVEMEYSRDGDKIFRTGTVLKDRSENIDGTILNKSGANKGPTFDDFYPAIKDLLDGSLQEAYGQEIPDTFHEFEQKFSQTGRDREVYISEIEGAFELMGLGTGAQDKQVKAWTLNQVYGVNSIEAVAKKNNATIKEGLEVIRAFANEYKVYFNKCLDNGTTPDRAKVQEIMKTFKEQPK